MPMVVWQGVAFRVPPHVIIDWFGSYQGSLDLAIVPTSSLSETCRATISPVQGVLRMGRKRNWKVYSTGQDARPPYSDGKAIFFREEAETGSEKGALRHAWSALVECDRRIRDDGRRRVPPLTLDDLELG